MVVGDILDRNFWRYPGRVAIIFENERIIGAKIVKENNEIKVHARLVVDASGVACAIRSKLPENYGMETWKYDSTNRFFVILHYIRWLKPDEPHPVTGDVWPYHFIFLDPGYMGDWAIMGIIGPESFKTVGKIMEEFLEVEQLPPFELKKKEYNSFPLTKPLISLVADGFLCAGDAAAMMNPIAARGIPETWRMSTDAAEVVDKLLKKEDYLSRERLWQVNIDYFRNDGAELAYQYMISAAIFNLKEEEANFLLKKLRSIVDPLGNEEEVVDVKLTFGKTVRIIYKVLGAILTGKIKFKTIGRLIKQARLAGKVKKHYKKYPENSKDLDEWVKKADEIWTKREVLPREFKTLTVNYP